MPADLVLISTDAGSAFFDTVSLDGETILSQRYSAGKDIATSNLQLASGMIMHDKHNPVIHDFHGVFSLKN